MTRRHSRPVAIALVTLLVLAGVAAAGCTTTASSTAIAVVNGVEIPKSAVDTQIAQMKKSSPASFEGTTGALVEQQYRAQVLNSLIQLELIKGAAKSLGVSVPSAQVDSYMTQLQQQYGGATALNNAMKAAGFTTATLRSQISDNLLANAVEAKVTTGSVTVTDAQITAYYDQNKTQFSTPAQVHAEHILVAATGTVLAQSLFTQVKAGADFAALAKKYSIDPGSKAAGGDLGWAAPNSYTPTFAVAVQAMKVNEVRLVESQYGWHVIKLLGRRAASQQTLAQATPAIQATLQQTAKTQAFTAYIADLQKKATIQILDANLKKIIDANNAVSAGGSTAATSGR
jgi:parvulin-like peptidyl-prolyl isomerase